MILRTYEIQSTHSYGERHCVVAEDMASAERAYLERYPEAVIQVLRLRSNRVIIADKGNLDDPR